MDDLKINTDITGAKEELQDDNNFISEKDSGVHKPKDCQTSFQKNSSLTRSEELSEDQSEQALSGGQSALFLPASTPAVPTENFPLPTGAVVNGPVSCSSSTKTSNMNEGSVSLTPGQPADQLAAESCSTLKAAADHQLSTPQKASQHQVLFLLSDVAHAKNPTHSIKKVPTSALVGCDVQNSVGNNMKSESTLLSQAEVGQGDASTVVRDDCVSALAVISSGTDEFRSENDTNWDPQKEFIQFLMTSEETVECHRGIAHGAAVKCPVVSSEVTQRKTQKKTSVKDSVIGSSKKPATYLCKMCPFTTSARSILKKHTEYLHSSACVDSFGNPLGLDKRKNDSLEESVDVDSTKSLAKQQPSTFPKNSALKQDAKRTFGSSSQSSNFSKFHKRPHRIQKARKSIAQSGVNSCSQNKSPHKNVMVKSSTDQQPKYFHQAPREKPNARADSSYLYRHKYNNYRTIRKSGDSYPLPFKKEVNSLNSLHLFSSSNSHNFISDPHNADTKRPENEKDHKRVAVKRVAKASKKESSAGEDLDSYPDFLHKMTVVVLQKLHSDKKDSYETEDDSSWDNVELGDYTTQAMEEEAYSDLSQEHVNLLPLFKSKIEGQGPGDSAALSYDQNDGFYFEYYEDGGTNSFLQDIHDPQHLENPETPLSKHSSVFHWTDLSLEKKSCPYCPATFETGVGLSNHVRGHLHRAGLSYEARHVVSPEQIATSDKMQHFKRTGNGTPVKRVRKAIDCKQKKSRSRSGSKKKMLTLPHGADEVYILRCRFCGLVFRGPLSVQEDWIKHLQRHIVNANLPRTGAGMVEVTSLLKKPASITETSFSLLMAEAAS